MELKTKTNLKKDAKLRADRVIISVETETTTVIQKNLKLKINLDLTK